MGCLNTDNTDGTDGKYSEFMSHWLLMTHNGRCRMERQQDLFITYSELYSELITCGRGLPYCFIRVNQRRTKRGNQKKK